MNASPVIVSFTDLEPEVSGRGLFGPRPWSPQSEGTNGASWRTSLGVRPLGSLEHLFWLMDQHQPVHFVLTAQIAGHTSPDDWRKALDCVQMRHPMLSVCIGRKPSSIPEFHRVDPAPIPLRLVFSNPETRWKDEVAEELAKPFELGCAPLLRAVIILGFGQAALLLTAHHSIADGLSLAFVIRDILQAINGDPPPPLPVPRSQEEVLGVCRVAMKSETTTPEGKDGPRQTSGPGRLRDDAKPKVRGLQLSANLTRRIRTRARAEGTSLHGALCAALVVAGRQISVPWREIPVRVLSPVDTRQILEAGEICGLFISVAAHEFATETKGFWDLARLAKRGVAAAKSRESITALASDLQRTVHRGMDVAGAGQFMATAFANEAMLTNLGALPLNNQHGRVKLQSLWGPATIAGCEDQQTIGAATVGEALCLTQTSHKPLEGLLEAIWAVLIEACPETREARAFA